MKNKFNYSLFFFLNVFYIINIALFCIKPNNQWKSFAENQPPKETHLLFKVSYEESLTVNGKVTTITKSMFHYSELKDCPFHPDYWRHID